MSSVYMVTFSAKGYGTATARCMSLNWGTDIQGDESESREHSSFYPKFVTESQFSVGVAFPTHALWHDFISWMEKYARTISDPDGTVGPMVVSIPFRKFTKVAIPTDGFQYGDNTAALVRRSIITFEGTNNPLKPGQKGTSSEPTIPPEVTVFYPTGLQAKGKVEDALYDGAYEPPAPVSATNHAEQNEMNQRNGGPSAGTGTGGEYD